MNHLQSGITHQRWPDSQRTQRLISPNPCQYHNRDRIDRITAKAARWMFVITTLEASEW
ncbi:hypothetical protein [Citrobacter amalonaticus]|uniref:hypothetical protein n=1 Tax=Citrobacter amalonaticus TaxID=35703 RepID=UPI003AAD9704